MIHEVIRRMINDQVNDLISTSQTNLVDSGVDSVAAVREHKQPLIAFSEEMGALNLELKRFLRDKLYRHYRVRRMSAKAGKIISGLYNAFVDDPSLMPDTVYDSLMDQDQVSNPDNPARVVADYIAGMTDRYAIKEYTRVFDPSELT